MEDRIIVEENGNTLIRDILFILKRNIILILVVVFLFAAGGVCYSFVVEPSYTASYRVIFQAQTSDNSAITTNINAMRAYIDTAVDFCDEGVVIDRANYYYENWKDEKNSGVYFSDYLASLEDSNENDYYSPEFVTPTLNYDKANINIITIEEDGSTQFVFSIGYTDSDVNVAKEKAGFLTCAFKKEINQMEGETGKYFGELKFDIQNRGYEGVSTNVSKTRIVLVATMIGAFIAVVLLYIKVLLDNTFKSRDELEEITGAPVFANIDFVGGGSNGK